MTGAHAEAVGDAIEAFAEWGQEVWSVHCADYALGMSASLRCGLAALPDNAAGAFIFLGDMPCVPLTIAEELVDAVEAGALAAAPARGERLGHPILITRALFSRFAAAAGDGEGRKILKGLGDGLAIVQCEDDGVLFDVDIPADLMAKTFGRQP